MIAVAAIAWLGATLASLGLVQLLGNLRSFPVLEPRTRRPERVVACIAARNEATTIAACVASLLAQPEIDAIVVCDDGSTDDTRAAVETIAGTTDRLWPIASTGSGKSAALATASDRALEREPAALLFVDADTRLKPGAVAALLAYKARARAHAVSVWPQTEARSMWDRTFAHAVVMFLLQALPLKLALDHRSPHFAAANGQVFLIDAGAYRRCGGHRAVTTIVEDVALARQLKAAGFRVALASGADIAVALGYGSLAGNAAGYGRSLLHGAGRAGCVAFLAWQGLAFALPWASLPFAPLPSSIALAASLVANAIVAVRLRSTSTVLASWTFGPWFVCAAAAATLARRRATTWRGRTYSPVR